MSTTRQITGTITTQGNKVIITLRKQSTYVRAKKPRLSVKDEHILRLMAQGLTNEAIAYRLSLKESRVKKRCCAIYKQLKVTNRIQAILKYQVRANYKPEFEFGHNGNNYQELSRREEQVLEYMAQGDSNKIIADKLKISVATTKKCTQSIFGKMGVEDRLQAALIYRSKKEDK